MGDPHPDTHNRTQGRDKSKQKEEMPHSSVQAHTRPDLLLAEESAGICTTNLSSLQSSDRPGSIWEDGNNGTLEKPKLRLRDYINVKTAFISTGVTGRSWDGQEVM